MKLPRLLAAAQGDRPASLDEHTAAHGPLARVGPELIEATRLAGLTGRGGASFPTAVKLRAVAAQRGPRLVLANGAEGEPMSAKDSTLLELAPHLVLDGALASAGAVGAARVVVAVPADADFAWEAVRRAIAERRDAGRVSLVRTPVAYLAGEESALIRRLNGGPLLPTVVPPRPFERGLKRRPTLVQNVETLAHIALIARHGPTWFREVGTAEQPGSALVTVSGAVGRPGVYEIGCGATLAEVLAAVGGAVEPLRAFLVGGYHGTWLPGDSDGISLDDRSLAAQGASLAAGVIVALGASACPVQESAQVMRWLADESAGQCGPCSNGLHGIAEGLRAMATGMAQPGAHELVARWSGDVARRGACNLPDGAVRFAASGLREFSAEWEAHRRRGPCAACRRPTTLAVPSEDRLAAA